MTPPAPPEQSRAVGCVIWSLVAVIVMAIGAVFLGSWRFSVLGEMPELRRPMAVLEGVVALDGTSPSTTVEAELRLDDGAVAAMREGDGLVHLELDVETEPDAAQLLVGVRWASRAEVVRPVESLVLDTDVRWTYACDDAADCARTIGLDLELPTSLAAAEVSWRLVATVRPPREASVPEVAVVELELVETSE
jgi:hypothetical protein